MLFEITEDMRCGIDESLCSADTDVALLSDAYTPMQIQRTGEQ